MLTALICLLAALSTACGDGTATQAPAQTPTSESSPLVSPLTSPLLVETPVPSVRFSVDKPLTADDTQVTGQGPAGVPLLLVNISAGGKELGSATIGEDNRFAFNLVDPLPAGHVIGIRLAVPKDPNTWFDLWAARGDGAKAIPQIGDFFDSAMVE
jgi:hypothetical protein